MRTTTLFLILALLLPALPVHAEPFAGISGAGDINLATDQSRQDAPLAAAAPDPEEALSPFGHNLFTGGFSGELENGLNPDYLVSEGDQIDLRIWGAIEVNEQLTVDPQGNIFIPKVGPVKVAGVRNDRLNRHVTRAISAVFTQNVQVYTALRSAQPVGVFVTGFVNNPGRFSGIASNSILYYIDRAGGIDPLRGSYRNVTIVRNGKTLNRADLYDFLLSGQLPTPQLKDGDTIVVGTRGNTVSISGDVRNAYVFELTGVQQSGKDLLAWSRPLASASHAQWRGVRSGESAAEYSPLSEFATIQFRDGDEIRITSDQRVDTIVIEVEGAFEGQSRYVVPRNLALQDMLDLIPVDTDIADVAGISVRRKSLAQRQKQSVDDALRRLESSYLLASSATDEEATIRAREAEMISSFIARARQVQPSGRLVLGAERSLSQVLLEDGDVITIPQKSHTVLISGEVLIPQSIVHSADMDIAGYVALAGGYTDSANPERILVLRPSGQVLIGDRQPVSPGDQIMVFPKFPSKNLQVAKSIVDVIYKVAVSAGVLVQL